MRLDTVSLWVAAARPSTLGLAVTPVMVGTALAWAADRNIHGLAVLAAFAGGVLIQAGTNLHNDAADSERGGDGPDRLGPPRVTAAGLISGRNIKRGARLCFATAALLGLYLVFIGGWPILMLGILSILSGWAYTGGPFPIAYTPFGELFVVAFFGPGAVCGTYWLCSGSIDAAALAAGVALGLLAGAVLLVNNHRDVEADMRVGRRTLAVLAGPQMTAWIYAAFILLPFALLPLIGHGQPHGHVWPAFATLPVALALIYRFMREPRGRVFNQILVRTVHMQFLFGFLLSVGLGL